MHGTGWLYLGVNEYSQNSVTFGIRLPFELGGYNNWVEMLTENFKFKDITMLATEFSVDDMPLEHPVRASFGIERHFIRHRFQLNVCGGAILRRPKRSVQGLEFERIRLTMSQLILAVQRMIPRSTIGVLL
jgi:hypothetical protein